MLQIIYTSASYELMSIEQLSRLMEQSRIRNYQLNITGFLVYDAGSFLQILEGPEAEVHAVYASILRDDRHTNIRQISQKKIANREFGDWAMAFAVPAGTPPVNEAFLDFDHAREEFCLDGSEASQILAMFQEGLLRQAEDYSSYAANVTVTLSSMKKTDTRQRQYLMDYGRVIALTVPDVQIDVTFEDQEPFHYNLSRNMCEGEIELF